METRRVVIIGGGFGGVNLLKKLTGSSAFTVTLVDRNNYNFFPPLMYQVATSYLQSSDISYPFRKLLRNRENVRFQIGELLAIIPEENKVQLSTGELLFDYLILATGVSTNYFGMENVKKFAFPMKSVSDALELRNHILQQVELAA